MMNGYRGNLILPVAGDITRANSAFAPSSPSFRAVRPEIHAKTASRVLFPVLLAIFLVGGCESELETGYKPRALNASSTDRRAYYAPPFTPEATSSTPRKILRFRIPQTGIVLATIFEPF